MAMVVKNNMGAVRTLNTLNKNSSALSKSLAKVSSGMKINSAQDDASGYAISERMRVQIRSLDQANQNTQNASSLMKTAEGALGSTIEILKSLKEKAVNAATDTNTDGDRATIQKEIDQFIDQIDDNALTTFNGKYLIDGSKKQQGVETYTAMTNQKLGLNDANGDAINSGTKLTNLTNRNNESLEIASNDKVTASFVKGGKTYTTTYTVSNTTLQDVFKRLNDEYNIKNGNVSADTDSTTVSGYDESGGNAVRNIAVQDEAAADAFGGPRLEGAGAADTSTSTSSTGGASGTQTNPYASAVSNAYNALSTAVNGLTNNVTGTNASKSANYLSDVKNVLSGYFNSLKSGTTYTASSASGLQSSAAYTGATYQGSTSNAAAVANVKNYALGTYNTTSGDTYSSSPVGWKGVSALQTAITNYNTAVSNYNNWTPPTPGGGGGGGSTSGDTDTLVYRSEEITGKGYLIGMGSGGTVDAVSKDDRVYTADGTVGYTVTAKHGGVEGQISGLTISISDSEGNVKKSANASLDGFETTIFATNKSDANELSFHVGASANQAIAVGMEDMRSEALGLKGSDGSKVSVATQDKANAAIDVFDNALQKALDQQATIGAIEARLEYTSANLTTSSENVQAAESVIRDADMAKEMTEYTKNNVLLQAAQSMLAQANQNSSAVLSLLQ